MDKTPPQLIQDLSTVASLAELSTAAHEALLESIRSSEPTTRLDLLAAAIEQATDDLENPLEFSHALTRLHRALLRPGGSGEEVLHELFRHNIQEIRAVLGRSLSDHAVDVSIGRAVALMETPLFVFHRAAFDLRAVDENHFDGASITTDLRPALNDDPTIGPVGVAAILRRHHLRISYVDGQGESKSFYVVLDDEDIAPLIGVLQRTLDASDLLHEFGESHGLHDISLR